MRSHLPPPEQAGGGASARASGRAKKWPSTLGGQPARKARPGTGYEAGFALGGGALLAILAARESL
jgi:hypothetical protein